jgi:four helix bundle protein
MNERVKVKTDNHIVVKSFDFSVRIVNLCKYLQSEKKEYILSKQLLRSGTSIGANVNESQAAQSTKDFIAKLSIASKEARETKYWIDLLTETDYLPKEHTKVRELQNQNMELIKILTSIIKTTQENQNG